MEALLLKSLYTWIVGTGGTMAAIAVGAGVWMHKRIKKNKDSIATQAIEDKRHSDILVKHDKVLALVNKDISYMKKQGDSMDQKLDRLLDK